MLSFFVPSTLYTSTDVEYVGYLEQTTYLTAFLFLRQSNKE
jgi:hypothetical protein